MPTDNLTFASLATLAGLSAAIYVLVTALRGVWPAAPAKALALILGIAISVAVAVLGGHSDGQAILLAVINGALAALIAAGGSLVTEAIAIANVQITAPPTTWWRAWR